MNKKPQEAVSHPPKTCLRWWLAFLQMSAFHCGPSVEDDGYQRKSCGKSGTIMDFMIVKNSKHCHWLQTTSSVFWIPVFLKQHGLHRSQWHAKAIYDDIEMNWYTNRLVNWKVTQCASWFVAHRPRRSSFLSSPLWTFYDKRFMCPASLIWKRNVSFRRAIGTWKPRFFKRQYYTSCQSQEHPCSSLVAICHCLAIAFYIHDTISLVNRTILRNPFFAHKNKHIFFVEFMTFARPSAMAVYLVNINLTITFLDYLEMFNGRLKYKSVLSSFLVKCFLRPFISYAVDCDLKVGFPELKRLCFSHSCRIITPAMLCWRLCSKQRHVILSLRSMASMLTRTSCIRACPSHHHQTHFHARTQTQPDQRLHCAVFDKMVDVSVPWHPASGEETPCLKKIAHIERSIRASQDF
jgi:hypothetical protein